MDDAMRDLYQDLILSHNKAPRNKHAMPEATRSLEGFNPLCGDRLTLYVRLDGDRVADISFTGHGCAIDTASASLMTEAVKGKTVAEAQELWDRFHHYLLRDQPVEASQLGKLAALGGVGEFASRIKCATLPWHTLTSVLKGGSGRVTTE